MASAKPLDTMDFEQLPLVADLPVPEQQPAPLPMVTLGARAGSAPAAAAAAASAPKAKISLPAPPEGAPAYWAEACRQLVRRDRVMKRLIPRFAHLALQPGGDAFATLARSIVGQQISMKAAQTLWNKFARLPARMAPDLVLKLKVDDMRAVGLSARKVDYLVDLAMHFKNKKVHRLHQWTTGRAWSDEGSRSLNWCQIRGMGTLDSRDVFDILICSDPMCCRWTMQA